MLVPTLSLTDVTLLLAVGVIVLLLTIELSSPNYGQTNLAVDRKKLKNAAYVTGGLFLVTAGITIIQILLR